MIGGVRSYAYAHNRTRFKWRLQMFLHKGLIFYFGLF